MSIVFDKTFGSFEEVIEHLLKSCEEELKSPDDEMSFSFDDPHAAEYAARAIQPHYAVALWSAADLLFYLNVKLRRPKPEA